MPVRVGFDTPISALSKVTVYISSNEYYDALYYESANWVELTSVTLDGVMYKVQTDRLPLVSMSEMTFTLAKPLAVAR